MASAPRTKIRGAVLSVVISGFISLVIAEYGLRYLESSGSFPAFFASLGQSAPPLETRDGPGMYYVHPYNAYSMKPGYTKDGFEYINKFGFRGEEVAAEKPDDVYRIVAIGGSTTFAVYLPWDESYPYYLQEELRSRLGTDKIEVLNAGLSGSTTGESLSRFYHQVLPADPDMLIVYHAFNDLLPRVFSNFQDDYFHFRRSNPTNPAPMTRFILWRMFLKVFSPAAFHENYNLQKIVWKFENLPDSDAERLANFFSTDESAFENNLDYIVAAADAHDVTPVLATFGISPDIVHWTDYIPAFAWEEGIRQNNRAIKRVAEKRGTTLVPFAEQTLDKPAINIWVADDQSCCWSDSIHMSRDGNKLKASIFADSIAPVVAEAMGITLPGSEPEETLPADSEEPEGEPVASVTQ